ncbi:hypothetical protein F2Q69_00029088 [Brassica cretica]|uniref:Uncharacterized protein n=1 Tax=Brassica cretica TaxID=69181 RepID=A0A8S9RVG6_BRACR|nr:hypothetical protein F2Q69_00029088 [Brassica cretica]
MKMAAGEDQMQGSSGREEKFCVSICLEPLNVKEGIMNDDPIVKIKLSTCRLAKRPKCTTIPLSIKSKETGNPPYLCTNTTNNSLNVVNNIGNSSILQRLHHSSDFTPYDPVIPSK